jgi:flagellar biosynthesis protein FlhF
MRLKSFYAKTLKEAMQMVRESLGEDAIIVATREERGDDGMGVCVTAAIDPSEHYEEPADFDFAGEEEAEGGWLQYDEEEEEQAVAEQITDVLLRHSVTDEIIDQVISCATVMGLPSADVSLTAAIEHLFSFRPLPQKPVKTAYMLVGPPGAGKTLATAKLAARAVMAGQRVSVISTDTVRAGGIEQLAAFTKLLDIGLMKAPGPKQLAHCLDKARGADQVYIDTAGINPFDPAEMRDLARFAGAGDIEPVLALPAGMDTDESGEIARVYAAIGVRALLGTRIDIARRLGGLLGAAHHGGLIFADVSNTAKVADGLHPLTPRRLTGLLMPEAAKKDREKSGAETETGKPPARKHTVKTG